MRANGIVLSIALAALACVPAFAAPTIFRSGPPDHAVSQTFDGTSLNLVTVTFDDTGPLSGDWDINFWSDSDRLAIDPLDDYAVRVVIDGSGDAAVLHRGDRIGPDSLFAHVADLSPDWLAGVDGYLGIEFGCAGRLADPAVEVCYGYIHIVTGDAQGFPATVANYAFDVAGFALFVDDEPTCWIKTETIFCDGLEATGMR